jgi:hypothetical protein
LFEQSPSVRQKNLAEDTFLKGSSTCMQNLTADSPIEAAGVSIPRLYKPVIYEEPPVSTLSPAEGYCFGATINIVPGNTARCRISQSQNAVTNSAIPQRSLGDSP